MAAVPLIEPIFPYKLKLFVTPWSMPCQRAINNLTALLKEHYPATYLLEIIDIKKDPDTAVSENIIYVPYLVKDSPEPRRSFLGDMSDHTKLLAGLTFS